MAGLASEMAKIGYSVKYVAERQMSDARAAMGWNLPKVSPAQLIVEPERGKLLSLVHQQSPDVIHLCQGLRGNGSIGVVQKELSHLGRRQWVIMETVEDQGYSGPFKRLIYSHLCRKFTAYGEGVLAIGQNTPRWLEQRGLSRSKIFPFAYFLPEQSYLAESHPLQNRAFRIVFAGQLVSRKRFQDLIFAVSQFGADVPPWEILVMGDGPEAAILRNLVKKYAPGRVRWMGQQPRIRVLELLAQADLLVLPSQHDGWGAVVSEALMAGTPAICSDRCGVSGVVLSSGTGGIFPTGDIRALSILLARMVKQGPVTLDQRAALRSWSECLGAKKGAQYLSAILSKNSKCALPSLPPWLESERALV